MSKKRRTRSERVLHKGIKQRKERYRRGRGGGESKFIVPHEEDDSPRFEPIGKKDTYIEELEKRGQFREITAEAHEVDFVGMAAEIYPRGALVRRGPDDCVLCEIAEYLWAKNETPVAAGDDVEVVNITEPNYEYAGRIVGIKPRTGVISIPDTRKGRKGAVYEKILAANIDVFVVVDSLVNPGLLLPFVDRCLIVGQREGDKTTVFCVNKIDLADGIPPEAAEYEAYVDHLVCTSARTGDGIDRLADIIAGRKAVVIGRSGVGKSSLLNALCPGLDLATRDVIRKSGKGVHTTRRYSLYELPNGGMVVDTPGVKEISLVNIERAELTWYFPEFADHRVNCRFNDCTHTHEPRCGVKAAVEEGLLSAYRYTTYCSLLESLEKNLPY